jgi:hypothetical protein
MQVPSGYQCRCCGQWHDALPYSYGTQAPAHWRDDFDGDPRSTLSDELCIIEGSHFFVRARIVIPVLDGPGEFDWGVWVSLSRRNFQRMLELWDTPGREGEPPYFGWLSTEIPIYQPTTLNLKTHVHTRPVGKRPSIELEPTDHPLAVEQRTGIPMAGVQEIAELLQHPA